MARGSVDRLLPVNLRMIVTQSAATTARIRPATCHMNGIHRRERGLRYCSTRPGQVPNERVRNGTV